MKKIGIIIAAFGALCLCFVNGRTIHNTSKGDEPKNNTSQAIVGVISGNVSSPEKPHIYCAVEGFFPYPNDCKKFYLCFENGDEINEQDESETDNESRWAVVLFECAPEMIFNPKTTTCDLPKNIQPPRDCAVPPTNLVNTAEIRENEREEVMDYDNDELKMPTPHPTESICPSEGFFVNPGDCSEYYRCVQNDDGSFRMVHFACSSGTIFDSNRGTCNPPSNVQTVQNCRNWIAAETVNGDDVDAAEEDDHVDDVAMSHNMLLDITEYEVHDENVNIDSDSEEGGKPAVLSAEDDDPNSNADDIDDASEKPFPPAHMPVGIMPEGIPENVSQIPIPEEFAVTESTGNGEQPPSSEKPESPEKPDGFTCTTDGFFAFPYSCRKYILCDDDFNVTLTCPPNQAFHRDQKRCTRDWSLCPEAPKCEKDDERFAYPHNSEYYFVCSSFSGDSTFSVERYRCFDNMIFDQEVQDCIPMPDEVEDNRR